MTSTHPILYKADVTVSREKRARYWRANLRILVILLLIWFGISYGLGILLVEPLNKVHLGGFPLGFWFSQQGSIYTFIVLIFVYARAMDRIDRDYERE